MSADNMSEVAYQAAYDNFEALAEAMGGRGPEYLDFEYTDASKLEEMVTGCTEGIFLVLLGGNDVSLSKGANKLVVSEPRTEEDLYEYIHSFVVFKTEEEGVQCFQQYPGGMDSDKECFPVDADFWDGLGHLTAHSRAGVVPKTFQRLFCGSTVPEPGLLPDHDSMIVKAYAF